jgi:hypothetical protein
MFICLLIPSSSPVSVLVITPVSSTYFDLHAPCTHLSTTVIDQHITCTTLIMSENSTDIERRDYGVDFNEHIFQIHHRNELRKVCIIAPTIRRMSFNFVCETG